MVYILAGLVLWTFSHAFKRFSPGLRDSMGDRAKGFVTAGLLASVVLMVIGYRLEDSMQLWILPDWVWPINNVLMLISVYLFAVGGARTRLALVMRHPMLNGMIVWGVAHLLVNGDLASLVLFGGLILWAKFAAFLINRSDAWTIPNPSPLGKEIGVAVTSVIVFVGIAYVHGLIGPVAVWPGWHG